MLCLVLFRPVDRVRGNGKRTPPVEIVVTLRSTRSNADAPTQSRRTSRLALQTSVCARHYSRHGSAYLDAGFFLNASDAFVLDPDAMVVHAGRRRSMQAYMHHSQSGLVLCY